jgi:hypothetical protein
LIYMPPSNELVATNWPVCMYVITEMMEQCALLFYFSYVMLVTLELLAKVKSKSKLCSGQNNSYDCYEKDGSHAAWLRKFTGAH